MKKLKLSIIITTRNRVSLLRNCICSIEKNNLGFLYEVIIIDDASSDGTQEFDINEFPNLNIVLIQNPQQMMMVRSRNIGARLAKGEFVLFIDDDNDRCYTDVPIQDKEANHILSGGTLTIDGDSIIADKRAKMYKDYQ